jgi:CRISPR/Cas system-associated endonuclease Cas3-HD
MNWSEIIPIVFLIAGGTSFIIAYVKSDVTKKTIGSLQELADALDKRVCALEDERDILINKVEKLEQENEILRSLVNGEHVTESLLEVLSDNHEKVMSTLNKILGR